MCQTVRIPFKADYSFHNYLPFSAEKNIKYCLKHKRFSFNRRNVQITCIQTYYLRQVQIPDRLDYSLRS